VRISGLRIQGHLNLDPPEIGSPLGVQGDVSTGISIGSSTDPQIQIGFDHIEIDHNEIYGWSDAGVFQQGFSYSATL